MDERNRATLEKLGQCIGSAIVHLGNEVYFRKVISVVFSEQDIALPKMRVCLEIIFIILDANTTAKETEKEYAKERAKIDKLHNACKMLKLDVLAR